MCKKVIVRSASQRSQETSKGLTTSRAACAANASFGRVSSEQELPDFGAGISLWRSCTVELRVLSSQCLVLVRRLHRSVWRRILILSVIPHGSPLSDSVPWFMLPNVPCLESVTTGSSVSNGNLTRCSDGFLVFNSTLHQTGLTYSSPKGG